jgi:hypothetical protein
MRALQFILLATLAGSSTASTEALPSFEALLAKCRAAYAVEVPKVFFQPSKQKWVKRIEYPDRFKYDVRKTDSLVSPVVGYIEASTIGTAGFADSEEQASAMRPTIAGLVSRATIRFNYAFRAGSWIFVGATETLAWRESEAGTFRDSTSYARTKASLIKEALPWEVCIPD